MYDATLAETVTIRGDGGDEIEAYLARPMSQGPLGGVVVIHHMPGYDAGAPPLPYHLSHRPHGSHPTDRRAARQRRERPVSWRSNAVNVGFHGVGRRRRGEDRLATWGERAPWG